MQCAATTSLENGGVDTGASNRPSCLETQVEGSYVAPMVGAASLENGRMEDTGIEPVTSALQRRRSPS